MALILCEVGRSERIEAEGRKATIVASIQIAAVGLEPGQSNNEVKGMVDRLVSTLRHEGNDVCAS
jgi:hypothetical protein